jgi:hypothetical protein
VQAHGKEVILSFEALPERTYTVQYRKNLKRSQNTKTWLTVTNVPALPVKRVITVIDDSAIYHGDGYYRVATPARE